MKSTQTNPEGMILEIQRMSTEDGPGIRTTVFLKGCSLKCVWCHNPESISSEPQLQWVDTTCIECGICIDECPANALTMEHGKIIINRQRCQPCEICAKACPSGALELMGSKWSEDNLINEILKDRAYFEKSSGGITLSGGEPALQSGFVASLFKRLKAEGIHTALDTCGMCSETQLKEILPYADLVLFDLKEIDPDRHKVFTGASNTVILNNLKFINDRIKNELRPKTLWIRTPIIPGRTDTHENILGIAYFLSENSIEFSRWELCSFNNLCNGKYERLGKVWDLKNESLLEKETMEALLETAQKGSRHQERIKWTGSVQTKRDDVAPEPGTLQPTDYCKITSISNL